MPGSTRIPKSNSVSHVSKQKEESRPSREQQSPEQRREQPREQQSKAAHVSKNVWDRRTRSISQEPVDPDEEAMDIAIGGEGKPWVQRKKVA